MTLREFWASDLCAGLSIKHRLLYAYLHSVCDCAGIVLAPLEQMAEIIGPVDPKSACNALEGLLQYERGRWLLCGYVAETAPKLYERPESPRHKGILKAAQRARVKIDEKTLKTCFSECIPVFADEEEAQNATRQAEPAESAKKEGKSSEVCQQNIFGDSGAVSVSFSESGQKPAKKTGSTRRPARAEEVREYAAQIGAVADPEEFFLHYESTGWMAGQTAIKNWRLKFQTWDKQKRARQPVNRRDRSPPVGHFSQIDYAKKIQSVKIDDENNLF